MVHLVRQDLSIAGKRAGLAGARSGLFMEQVRIVKEMRAEDIRNGRTGNMVRPRFLVWENVGGAYSSNKGKDFAAVLEEIIKIVEPEAPSIEVPENGWPSWGGYHDEVGGRWSVVWRTHDAQYWGKTIRDSRTGDVLQMGTPQRRRRISVVADFGGDAAGEILFEQQGMSGYPAESGAAGEGLAEAAESGVNPAIARCLTPWDAQSQRVYDEKGVMASISADTMQVTSKENGSVPEFGKPCHTLNANAHVPCVALDISHRQDAVRECGQIAPTLTARSGTGGGNVPLTYGIGNGQAHEGAAMTEEVSQTLNTMHDAQAVMCEDVAHREDTETYPVQNMVVRRLTPLECTRLQGYPDGWVDIGEWVDEQGKTHKEADSPKYKALGNSIALPFWQWMIDRMAEYLPENATLGSLFDGIGGFPLCWSRTYSLECCRWASEIEQFPIAVTKMRFGEE